MTAPDADNDGLADSSPVGLTKPLVITEATFSSSTASADSDADGVSDLKEAMALVYDGTNPNSNDSDGDGVLDKNDMNPAYRIRDHIAKATPLLTANNLRWRWTLISNQWDIRTPGLSGQ